MENVPEHLAGRHIEEDGKEAAQGAHGQSMGQFCAQRCKEDTGAEHTIIQNFEYSKSLLLSQIPRPTVD